MTQNNKINYIEIPAQNIVATKAFFSDVFGWSFVESAALDILKTLYVDTAPVRGEIPDIELLELCQ